VGILVSLDRSTVKAIALPKTGIHFTARFHRLAAESLRREPEE
jgi:hypothetical protein